MHQWKQRNVLNLPIDHSKFNGTLLDNLYELRTLRILDASYNKLAGELWPGIGNLAHLKVINFWQNVLLKYLRKFYP